MASVWAIIDADIRDDSLATDPGANGNEAGVDTAERADQEEDESSHRLQLTESAREWIRATVLGGIDRYCEREGKRMYVDKSLDSVFALDVVKQVFPDVRCILAFRHVMDTIASGIEASPWGFQAYGYAPYVQSNPGNSVAALGSYWLHHVTQALEWERRNPDACLRVRYEDLVAQPDVKVQEIQRFLGSSVVLVGISPAW